MKLSARIKTLREKMVTMPEICVERGYLLTQSYKETEGQPEVIRKAKAVAKVLKEMPIVIEDDELIIGMPTSKLRAGALTPELNAGWYGKEGELLSTREWDRFVPLTAEEISKMKEIAHYWQGKSLADKWNSRIPEAALKLNGVVQGGGAFCCNNQYFGHVSIDYYKILTLGLSGIKAQVDQELNKLNLAFIEDLKKYQFLTAINIMLDGALTFAQRHADAAIELAQKETNPKRKAELEEIAAICRNVPNNPARNFREAVQATWFTLVIVMIEGWGTGIGFLRPDQYLYPFYKKDIEAGQITNEQALDLIALLFIKLNGPVNPYSSELVRCFCGFSLAATITLGGLSPDGKDAVNELSYLFLDAEQQVALNSEDIVVRIHKKTPLAFVLKACEVAKALCGKVKFVSDETVITQLMIDGKPLEWARSYSITGCNTPTIPGYSLDVPGGIVNTPLMLELALNNGVWRQTGEQIGPKTGDPRNFVSYEDVWQAFKTQLEALLPVALMFKNTDKQLYADFAPCPFQSALLHGCIEKGIDVNSGGTAPYITYAVSLGGVPNVGDSLAAIKKAVFEDKIISMDKLLVALDKNFDGEAAILHILESTPKFGNNDDYVDSIVNDILSMGSEFAAKVPGVAGAISNVAAATITANIPLGYSVGALPDGRKAGEALSEGGISPHQGRNVSGPTATMMSVAKLDHSRLTNGSVLNMKISPGALKDAAKLQKLAILIRTFCETGGMLVQFNIVSTATLKDAQQHPEKYKDLLVRVATFSSYFVELSPELQNDIIARMEFEDV
ncbi:MAG: pyruvate formate-lyase [Firmicutes bacterium]|nr:pyruvate formate-lyase [Bacillota bacterium]